MTPTRRRALEWVRDDGVPLELPNDPNEPSRQMLMRLEREGLVFYGLREPTSRGLRYELSPAGKRALDVQDPAQ